MNYELFNRTLLSTTNQEERIHFARKHFFHGIPFVFKDREDQYFEFRSKIARQFNLNFGEVFIVGSAKFGFSYIKGTEFSYESDIDVVLVNEQLFEHFYQKISEYQYQMDRFHHTISLDEKKQYNKFLRYLVKGWMRPDLLPYSFQIEILKKEWFNFFNSISNGKSEVGNYEVKAGLYKGYYYLEKYYMNGIEGYYNKRKMEIVGG
ncbi:hypothetical protein ACDZ28_26710 [Paenibacillus sp. RS8]|uniref:hypothetical protein n=1 Tax=Paenibacillus sp. RS8 TaxID=3242681 RepID=UPI0035C1977E